MSAVAGVGVIDIVPNMQGLGTSLAAASGPLKSGLSTLAKTIGVTLGGAALVSFAKSSVAAFDELEAASQRLAYGLDKIGQGGSLDSVLAWAKSFSLATGINEATIVDMASKLQNMGQAFFAAAGPSASGLLDKLTQGLTDMGAAIGKTAGLLMRSLAPAILNAPEKAVPMLQKYGALTDEQATKVLALVAAGKKQAATTLEITAIQTKYNGAAAATATLTDKLKNVWNQLNITVGGFLNEVLSKAVDRLGEMNPIMKELAAAIGLASIAMVALNGISNSFIGTAITKMLVGLRGLIVEFALVADIEGVAAAATGVFGAALGLLATPAVAFTLALAGVGLAVVKVMGLMNKSKGEGQQWADSILAGKFSVTQLNDAVQKVTGNTSLSDWWNGDKITLDAFKASVDDLITKFQKVPGVLSATDAAQIKYDLSLGDGAGAAGILDRALVRYNATLDSSRSHLDAAGKAVRNFGNMTTGDLKSFASGIANALDPVSGAITDMTGTFSDSAKKVAASFGKMVDAAKRWARDISIINNSGLTDAQKKVLLANQQLGDAWVRGGAKIKQSIVANINQLGQAQGKIDDVKRAVLGVPPLHIDTSQAIGNVNSLRNAVEQLIAALARVHLPANGLGGSSAQGPRGPGGATGAIVTKPTWSLIGEAGPEALIPLNRMPGARALPSGDLGRSEVRGRMGGTLHMIDWRTGMVSLEAEVDWADATSGW